MAADDFFARWSKRRQPEADTALAPVAVDGAADAGQPAAPEPSEQLAPTMEEVSRLTAESDYSRFIARGVDESVKRAAMKKLFSDPHFNLMDGLDTYIDDYNVFEPIPPEMLRALNHGKALLDPLGQLEKPLMELVQKVVEIDAAMPAGEAQAAAALPDPEPVAAPADPDMRQPDVQPLPREIPTATPTTSDRGST